MIPLRDAPLPTFRTGAEIRRRAAEALRPPRRVTVSEAAARHRRLNNPGSYVGPWRNETTPYLVEPMDRALRRDTDEIYLIAPSQTAKTEVHLNLIGHGIKYRPADALLFQPTKDLAEDFAVRRVVNKFLKPSPDLAGELGISKSDDNVMTKRFRNGFSLTVSWPSPAQLSSRPVQMVLIDERDRMPDDIGGEGDPVDLGRKRKQTFGRNGVLVCTSSPSRIDGTGIVAHWPAGDQRLLFWPCPECGEFWSPGFNADRKPDLPEAEGRLGELRWDAAVPASEVRDTAWLECPCCAARLTEKDKPQMLARAMWLPRGMAVAASGSVSGTMPRTRIGSYWLTGLATPFQTWGELAEKFVAAKEHFDRTGDENKLKTFFNTDMGVPYKPRHEGAAPLEADELDGRRDGYSLGTVPAGVRYLTASVDIQGDRFEVLVRGWNETTESWLIDRFAIRTMPDGRSDVRPARHPEQWDVLLDRVFRRSYQLVEVPGKSLSVANVAIDTGGHEDVTANAKSFWRRARAAGIGDRQITLVKGASTATARALPAPTFEVDDKGKRRPGSPKLFVIGVHELKNTIDNRLRREKPGPGYLHYPADVPPRYFEEMTGEIRVKGRWQRRGPNESWDLEVYAELARLRLRPERVNWNKPPLWAALREAAAEEPETEIEQVPVPLVRPARQVKRARRPGGFVNGWR